MKWTITHTWDYDPLHQWHCDTFTEAVHLGQALTNSVGNVYIWKETSGNPIKWMEVKQDASQSIQR